MMYKPVQELAIDSIIVGVRARKEFGDIDELAKSISEIGLLHPILVATFENSFSLVDGQRRLLACKQLGMETVPVVVFDALVKENNDLVKERRAEFDSNMVRKDFTPSESVWLSGHILDMIEAKRKLAEDLKETREDFYGGKLPPEKQNLVPPSNGRNDMKGKKTRDIVAGAVGMSYKTLEKAKAIVESAAENPENADLVQQMDETGKVDPAYKELQDRKGIGKQQDGIPGKVTSLIVRMPDGRQKKMGSISTEWFQNRNILQWIIENVGLGVDEKDIIIQRQGNVVSIFDSTNVDKLRQGIKYLVDRYSFQGSLMNVIGKEKDQDGY